jgi:hypothetical protein
MTNTDASWYFIETDSSVVSSVDTIINDVSWWNVYLTG